MPLEPIVAYKCDSCDELSETCEAESIYECGTCGSSFLRSNSSDGDSSRCPSCNKFSSKLADSACSQCQEGGVEEVSAVKCSVCGKITEVPDGADIPTECPECKEGEMRKKEESRLASLPPDQRGGQTVFKTREDAEIAFKLFLASVRSDVVGLEAAPSRELDSDKYGQAVQKGGILWRELPTPLVGFHFHPVFSLPADRYISEYAQQPCYLTDGFFADVEKAAKQYLKCGEVHWNNTRSNAWAYVEK